MLKIGLLLPVALALNGRHRQEPELVAPDAEEATEEVVEGTEQGVVAAEGEAAVEAAEAAAAAEPSDVEEPEPAEGLPVDEVMFQISIFTTAFKHLHKICQRFCRLKCVQYN